MDKKGSSIILVLMLGVVFFWLGLALAPALKDVTQEAMDDSLLHCGNATAQQTKAVCTSLDVMPPFFIGIVFGLAGILLARIVT